MTTENRPSFRDQVQARLYQAVFSATDFFNHSLPRERKWLGFGLAALSLLAIGSITYLALKKKFSRPQINSDENFPT